MSFLAVWWWEDIASAGKWVSSQSCCEVLLNLAVALRTKRRSW